MYDFIDEYSEKIKLEIDKIRKEWENEKHSLEEQILDLGGELENTKKKTEAAMKEAEEAKIQLSKAKSVRASLEGYKQSVNIITEWAASQREAIEVLIACSEIENITLEDLASHTKIGIMILKRNVLPNLENKGFITIQKIENDIEIINLAKKQPNSS